MLAFLENEFRLKGRYSQKNREEGNYVMPIGSLSQSCRVTGRYQVISRNNLTIVAMLSADVCRAQGESPATLEREWSTPPVPFSV